MNVNDIAKRFANGRIEKLRLIADRIAAERNKQPEPPPPPCIEVTVPDQPAPVVNVTNEIPQHLPPINVQLIVPPEAIKIIFECPPSNISVNVPEQPAPRITVNPPTINLEPKIEVTVPKQDKQERPTKARIKHADGTSSTVEIG